MSVPNFKEIPGGMQWRREGGPAGPRNLNVVVEKSVKELLECKIMCYTS